MSIHVHFATDDINQEQYRKIMRELETKLKGLPEKRLFHICFFSYGQLNISEIWESEIEFRKYYKVFEALINEMNFGFVEYEISKIENIILYRINFDDIFELKHAES